MEFHYKVENKVSLIESHSLYNRLNLKKVKKRIKISWSVVI